MRRSTTTIAWWCERTAPRPAGCAAGTGVVLRTTGAGAGTSATNAPAGGVSVGGWGCEAVSSTVVLIRRRTSCVRPRSPENSGRSLMLRQRRDVRVGLARQLAGGRHPRVAVVAAVRILAAVVAARLLVLHL